MSVASADLRAARDQSPGGMLEPSQYAIEASSLHKKFGTRSAVNGVSLRLGHGECLALFGPNGAGKSTLLKLLAGLLRPTSGELRIDGIPRASGELARARVGYLSHASMLYSALTARENVEFSARLYGVADPRAAAVASLEKLEIASRADRPARELSRGMQQRVSLARAMVHGPSVLLLDEPFTGLDDSGAAALTELLGAVRLGSGTLVLVTHNLAEGLALATQVAVMREGGLVRQESRDNIDPSSYAAEYRALISNER